MTMVDVQFSLQGAYIPVDHGYHLLSAVAQVIPELHSDRQAGIHPISGRLAGDRLQLLTPRSRLTIRISSDRIGRILPLAGKSLCIGDYKVFVGVPRTKALVPAACLYSRLVVIKGFMEPEPFLEAVSRQLDLLGIQGIPGLIIRKDEKSHEGRVGREPGRCPFVRRTIRIRDKEVVGYEVEVSGLCAEDSIKLQEHGLGGRRRFGCGVFVERRVTTHESNITGKEAHQA